MNWTRFAAASGALLVTFTAVWSVALAAYPRGVTLPAHPSATAPATCPPG